MIQEVLAGMILGHLSNSNLGQCELVKAVAVTLSEAVSLLSTYLGKKL